MPVFHNLYSTLLFWIAVLLALVGLFIFIVQVIRWDREYEAFLVFPIRLAIYALPYMLVPGLGIAVGGLMYKSPRRVRRKFGKASIYTSVIGLMFWITSLSMRIR